MREFKVGDKVRVKVDGFNNVWEGQEGEITEVLAGYYPYLVKLSKIGAVIMFNESELEPMSEGKIFIFRK